VGGRGMEGSRSRGREVGWVGGEEEGERGGGGGGARNAKLSDEKR